MILRKPYAFLIKYFQIIHILLFLICGYMLYQLRINYIFFRNFVKNDNYQYFEDMASYYLPIMLFIGVILTLIMVIAIFHLMRQKEKPVLFYRIYIIYSIVLLITLIVYYNFYRGLEFESYDLVSLSIYRDIMGVMYYILYFFLIFNFIRGFGFDIKKFNFDKDLKALNITDEDREEFEVDFSLDKDKIIENFRREKRYVKYYIKENALMLSIIGFLIIALGVFLLYGKIGQKSIVYNQNDVVTANGFSIKIENAYLTNKDKNNQDANGNYLVINFKIQNNGTNNREFESDMARVLINGEYYYAIYDKYSLFNDFNTGYNKQKLSFGKTESFVLVFKIDNLDIDDAILELFNYQSDDFYYQKVSLDLIKTDDVKIMNTFNKSDEIIIDNVFFKGKFYIDEYQINNRFYIEYEKCYENECNVYKNNIWSAGNYVMKLSFKDYDLSLESLENYISILYKKDDSLYENNVSVLYNNDDTLYLEVDLNLEKSDLIVLKINIHSFLYEIILKGEYYVS